MNRSAKSNAPFSVVVRDATQVTPRSESSPWGQIVQINATPNSDNSGSIDLQIEGVAGNVNSVFCTITTGAYISASDPAAPGVDGSFTCSATGLAVQGSVLSVVLADPDSQTALDRISVNLGVGSVLSVPTGMTPAEIPFAAGHPDRIIETRSIAVLSESRATLGGKNVRWASFGPLLVPIDQIPDGVRQIKAPDSSQGLSDRGPIENGVTEGWAAALTREIREVAAASEDRKLSRSSASANSVRLYANSRLSKQFLEEISSDEKLQSDLQGWLSGTLQVFGKVDWLGVIFHERVRARPVQVVVGETVQVLWVAPGDTVQITQKFSTKRSTEFESVMDQETEQQLDFDSTWSTDWSRGATSTTTTSIGGNETLGAGPFPDLPITVSSGLNFNQSFSDTADEKLQLSQQVSAKQSAKAREEHKVTVKRSTDIQDESGVSRTTRNLNPGRSLSFEIKKMYRKDHISFERFDAQLCLALTAIDPGREIRAQFLALLWQIYSRRRSVQSHFRQCGHRCGGSRAKSSRMAWRTAGKVG